MEIKPCPKCGKLPKIEIVEKRVNSVIVKLSCKKDVFQFFYGWQEETHQEVMSARETTADAIAEAIELWNKKYEDATLTLLEKVLVERINECKKENENG